MSTNPFHNALEQLKRAGKDASVQQETLERLALPERELRVSIPVRMDDGTVKFFEGYRVQHSSVRGPYKGGIRFHKNADIDEVRALSLWMTMKTAVADIKMGGGKGGITVDPKTLSKGELERLSRGWVRALWRDLGPRVDVPAPDVNTNGEIMRWMLDEYETLTGNKNPAAFTGKPISDGGSEGREEATGQGGFYVFNALKEQLGIHEGASVAIQGMGNVGGHAAEIFHAHGYTIVAMSDSKGGIYNKDGLNPADVEAYKKAHGSLVGYPSAQQVTNAELLELPVDVLVPAALENQITADNVAHIRARVVLELANGPTTPEADDSLFARGIPLVPDILANAGGVIVSTYEWEQNLGGEHWSKDAVNEKLRAQLETQARAVWDKAQALHTDIRRAAFALALERIERALSTN